MPLHKTYGWVPDLPDQRDHLYAAPLMELKTIPSKIDLTSHCPAVYDQGQLGSCTANAIAAAIEFDLMKQKKHAFIPSRLFIYYNERAIEHTVDSDSGAMIRDGIKSVAKKGDAPEPEWPYDISKFTLKPPAKVFQDAKKHKAVQYQRVAQNLTEMRGCLASGYPFVFGFTVYESFESQAVAHSGVVPMPGERTISRRACHWRSAMMTVSNASSCAIPGVRIGERKVTSQYHIPTCRNPIYRTTSGRSAWSPRAVLRIGQGNGLVHSISVKLRTVLVSHGRA